MDNNKEYRMYCLVLRQLNPIQKGIQSAHAIVEYGNHYFMTDEYHQWSTKDKTIIMLDGGTSPEIYNLIDELRHIDVKYSIFREPDLGDLVTCISFLASNDVWDNESYRIQDPYIPYSDEDRQNYYLSLLISNLRLSF